MFAKSNRPHVGPRARHTAPPPRGALDADSQASLHALSHVHTLSLLPPLLPLPILLFPPAAFIFGRPPPRLAIPQLLVGIFRAASRAALVCRAWHVVADVVLWEDMPGLAPLLMLMPEDAWTMVSPGVCARDDDSRRD